MSKCIKCTQGIYTLLTHLKNLSFLMDVPQNVLAFKHGHIKLNLLFDPFNTKDMFLYVFHSDWNMLFEKFKQTP
jgi:hypothetical protein